MYHSCITRILNHRQEKSRYACSSDKVTGPKWAPFSWFHFKFRTIINRSCSWFISTPFYIYILTFDLNLKNYHFIYLPTTWPPVVGNGILLSSTGLYVVVVVVVLLRVVVVVVVWCKMFPVSRFVEFGVALVRWRSTRSLLTKPSVSACNKSICFQLVSQSGKLLLNTGCNFNL